MNYEEKNVCKRHELELKESDKKLNFLKENILKKNGNNLHKREKICLKHPQRSRLVRNLDLNEYVLLQKDLYRIFESNLNEDKMVTSLKIVELLNDIGKLNQKEEIMLLILN